jgi:hypothetical protein
MKRNKACISLLATVLVMLLCTSNVLAYDTFNDHKLTSSSQILYYIDSSANEYKESIMYGFQYWNGLVTGVSCYQTTTKAYSRCDAYWGNYDIDGEGWIAATYLYYNQQISPYDSNWYWCEVYFSSARFSYSGLSYNNRKGTACHEMGHVWGLDHSNITTNVMCIYDGGRSVYQPSTNDIAVVEYLY